VEAPERLTESTHWFKRMSPSTPLEFVYTFVPDSGERHHPSGQWHYIGDEEQEQEQEYEQHEQHEQRKETCNNAVRMEFWQASEEHKCSVA
jgi:hypothetical protein